MRVRDIMTSEVNTASPESTLEEVATMMRDEDVGAIPVVEDEELIGIVTDRDIVVRCVAGGRDPSEVAVEEILSEDLETVEPDADVEEAAELMRSKQIRRLPVVENGRLAGMLSLGDIAVEEPGTSGEALEGVSRGVERSGKKAPQAVSDGRRDGGRQQTMEQQSGRRQSSARESGRSSSRKPDLSPARGNTGGISSRGQEQSRQSRGASGREKPARGRKAG